jgi:hypothetical protein
LPPSMPAARATPMESRYRAEPGMMEIGTFMRPAYPSD